MTRPSFRPCGPKAPRQMPGWIEPLGYGKRVSGLDGLTVYGGRSGCPGVP